MAKEISFRCRLVSKMPYLLLKFLIKENCLHEFVEACLHIESPAHLFRTWALPTKNGVSWEYKKISLTKCMHDMIVFNNYWFRRYWAFEKFLEEYEKAHSK